VKRVKDSTLPQGKQVVEHRGAPARSTSVRRLVYDQSGKLLYDDVWYSNYHAQPRVIRVGVKKGVPASIPGSGQTLGGPNRASTPARASREGGR
jgi:hypothetical protein